jgi:3-oxoadipate enol-lactonase / 4-carboxymuconolactone decarboxylase
MNYKLEGTPNSPVLIFSNSLGTTLQMWDELVPLLLPYFRVLRYDTRGHGKSPATPGEYTIDQLGNDVIRLMDELKIEKAFFCGLSMGGLIGQWLAINKASRFYIIAISNTAAKIGNADGWNERINNLNANGMEAIVEGTLLKWFTHDFLTTQKKEVEVLKQSFLNANVDGYCSCCAAIRDADYKETLQNVLTQVVIIAGEQDPVTTVADAQFMHERLPDAALEILPAKHLSSTELPNEFAQILINHFAGETTFEKGMHVRRTVLGNEHVDKASAKINDFNGDFQSFISNYAWGEVWTRPGLPKHTRSLITLSMLIALNRPNEFKMHVKAAFNNGVTKDEIKEVIMQSALYCGLPAANDAIHLAEEVFQMTNK